MREILGRRLRRLLGAATPGRVWGSPRHDAPAVLLDAALTCATAWQWPVLPGVGSVPAADGGERCACPDPDCVVPGAHPFDPGLLAATTDERMVRWWWTNRPTAPVILATGGRAPCAVSLPAA
ncbi:bifunctional DNA primase/polymerase, partial [Streptomyces sp. 12297]